MKKTVYSIFASAFIALSVISLLLVFSLSAFAEEGSITENETVSEEENTDITAYFNDTVLPLIISAATTLIAALPFIIPVIKKNAKYNKLQAFYSRACDEITRLEEFVKSNDVENFKSKIAEAMSEELTKAVTSLKIESGVYADIVSKIETLSAQMNALSRGAANAWAQSPGAVACLSEAPTEYAVKKQSMELKALEDYIREIKGEEAEAIITELKGGETV